MTAPAVEARVDPASFRELLAAVKAFDPALSRALRTRLRQAGEDSVAEVRRTLLMPTRDGTPPHPGGVRESLADSTRVSLLAGKRAQGVRISTSSRKLAAIHKAMLKAYNRNTWRHPAPHPGSGKWVTQSGRPYFGAVIASRKAEMRVAVEAALNDARAAIY